LHRAFSKAYLRKLLNSGKAAVETERSVACDPAWLIPPNLSAADLYALRRDAEGVPSTRPAHLREPMPGEVLGAFHLLMVSAGAVANSGGYQLNGEQIRVINGANFYLGTLREVFSDEPPGISDATVVVCVGAADVPYPGSVVRTGVPGSVIRGAVTGAWVDLPTGRARLGV